MTTQKLDATCVREMTFADLYLGHPSLGNRFSAVPKAPADPVLASPSLDADLKTLYERCVDAYNQSRDGDFKLVYDGVSYRVAIMQSMGGLVFVLRKMVSNIRSMHELGVPSIYTQPLMQQNLRGLLLIAGTMNSGKTTTAGAIIAGRLARYGGVAVTAEDPVELPLEGEHGLGVCFQTHASRERGGFAESCRSLVRWGARIIYLGEIRDGETAVEALRAGVNGHLVISTLHAEDIQTALRRMLAMAAEHFDAASANSLLADGLVGVMHQRLVGDPRRLEADLLMLSDAPSATTMIREGKLERLASEIRLQQARLIQSTAMMDQR